MSSISQPSRSRSIGVCGMGGWAGSICKQMLGLSQTGRGLRFVAACDPSPQAFPDLIEPLQQAGVGIYTGIDDLLKQPIDTVWIAAPIHLHRPFTEKAIRADKAVICEKPAAGCVADVDAMIRARDAAGLPVVIAFQDAYRPPMRELKRRLDAGEFGEVRSVSVLGCWPRTDRYFSRNSWVGRRRVGESGVYDSPPMNAMAHFLQAGLMMASSDPVARVAKVRAELFRAWDVETFDTCAVELTLHNRVVLRFGMTHSCLNTVEPVVRVRTDRASIEAHPRSGIHIVAEREESHPIAGYPAAEVLAGLDDPLGAVTPERAREQVRVCESLGRSDQVRSVEFTRSASGKPGETLRVIEGIELALARFVEQGDFPSEVSSTRFGAGPVEVAMVDG